LTIKGNLDQDFDNFNQDIERILEKELTRIREEINALKDKANSMSKVLLGPIPDEEKRI
jgi:hypothetical protein